MKATPITQESISTSNSVVATSTMATNGHLVQRACSCGGKSPLGGECEECQRTSLAGSAGLLVQPKLTVNRPDDPFEREADRMAERVVQRQTVQRQTMPEEEEEELQTKPLGVQRQAEEEEEEELQAKGGTLSRPPMTPATEAGIRKLRAGTGQPLPASTRAALEPHYGHSFANVRVHTGGQAAHLARGLRAQAFTVGRDIVFGAGQFAPQSSSGLKLLAHELTHTVQQGAVSRRSVRRKEAT